jgi:hypothetical protein
MLGHGPAEWVAASRHNGTPAVLLKSPLKQAPVRPPFEPWLGGTREALALEP